MKRGGKKVKGDYQIKDINKSFNPIFIHGMNMFFDPFTKNQIQLQKPSLLTPIQ